MDENIQQALEHLYGDKVPNLTRWGYLEALRQLRRKDPNLARRVERALEPLLQERAFPRRQREWFDASAGTRARLALLSENPHLQRDVAVIRQILGLPDDQIKPKIDDPLCQEMGSLTGLEDPREVVESNVVGWWLQLHHEASVGPVESVEIADLLSLDLVRSATCSAQIDLKAEGVPQWLQCPPRGPGLYHQPKTPIHWAAGRLVERYCLPWSAAIPLTFYIMTQNKSWIEGLEVLYPGVAVTYDKSSKDPGTFNLKVQRIDEFLTKEDWDRLWVQHVRPRQEDLWGQRGMKPQGRYGPDLARLKRAMPLYHNLVEEERSLRELLEMAPVDWDQETIRGAMRDLERLLTPLP